MITAKGVGFLIAAVLLFFLARLTGVGWLYLVDSVLWGMILLSALLPWLGVARLEAQRRVELPGAPEGATGPAEGDSVHIELSLRNRAFWPRFFLSLSYDCSLAAPESRRQRFFIANLAGSSRFSMSSTMVAYQRGMHSLGPVEANASAPFGLFRRRVWLDRRLPVLVYPQVFPLERLPLADGLAGEALRPQKVRAGLETVGSRPYFPGDPRRYIHWRNTARSGRPMVKEFEDPRDQTLHLLFDATRVWGAGRETTLEYAIKVVASVADYARRRRVPVQVWGGDLQGAACGGPATDGRQWTELLQGLALVASGDGTSLSAHLGHLTPGASALVVVSRGDQQSVRSLGLYGPSLQHLAVVALEEFGEPAPEDDLMDSLELARISVARCRPGQLLLLLQALEQLGQPTYEKVKVA